MNGESNLNELLRTLTPVLCDRKYIFSVVDPVTFVDGHVDIWARIEEEEGATIVSVDANLEWQRIEAARWARITLGVHSSLAAVGLTASVAGALAAAEMPANVLAGFHHDHVFVPWDRRQEALLLLQALSRDRSP